MATSNDTRVTSGNPDDTFSAAMSNPSESMDTNSVVIEVESRTLGTVSRQKQLVLTLRNSGGTQLATFTTANITGTDTTYTSGSTTVSGLSETDVAGWYVDALVTESGGMADTATVEIDFLRVTIDYAPGAQAVTGTTTLTNTSTFPSTGTITTTYDITGDTLFTNNNTFPSPGEVIQEQFITGDTLFTNINTFPAGGLVAVDQEVTGTTTLTNTSTFPSTGDITTTYDVTGTSLYINSNTFPSPGLVAEDQLITGTALLTNNSSFFATGDLTLTETTRRIVIT
jgi:hypothetical protein